MNLQSGGGASNPSTPQGNGRARRRSTTGAAQQNRKAWGRQWGSVGAEWKRNNNPRG